MSRLCQWPWCTAETCHPLSPWCCKHKIAHRQDRDRERKRGLRVTDPERQRGYQRKYYRFHREEELARRRRPEARERNREACRRWREKFPERAKSCWKRWKLANPERLKLGRKLQRAARTEPSAFMALKAARMKTCDRLHLTQLHLPCGTIPACNGCPQIGGRFVGLVEKGFKFGRAS